jgi:iron complex transport system substrate-binding protein
VFDSTVATEAKAPFLEDPPAAAPTLAAYVTTGQMMQGITLAPTDVTVDGDTATVTYDILFAGTAAYEDQTGEVVKLDGAWKVTTEQFCSFMATARTPCA